MVHPSLTPLPILCWILPPHFLSFLHPYTFPYTRPSWVPMQPKHQLGLRCMHSDGLALLGHRMAAVPTSLSVRRVPHRATGPVASTVSLNPRPLTPPDTAEAELVFLGMQNCTSSDRHSIFLQNQTKKAGTGSCRGSEVLPRAIHTAPGGICANQPVRLSTVTTSADSLFAASSHEAHAKYQPRATTTVPRYVAMLRVAYPLT